MKWCDWCQCYHHKEADHIGKFQILDIKSQKIYTSTNEAKKDGKTKLIRVYVRPEGGQGDM